MMRKYPLCQFLEAFKEAGYAIGPSNFADCTKCPNGDFGISVYNPNKIPNDHGEKNIFNYPDRDQAVCDHGSMFFAVDAAFDYFYKFVTESSRWDEVDAVVIDIMMPPGTRLPGTYKNSNVNGDNAGVYLKKYLSELVTKFRIPQNPGVILPVMVLTNRLADDRANPPKVNQNGRQPKPQDGAKDRLWVWNMEKTFALNNPDSLVINLKKIVDGRVK